MALLALSACSSKNDTFEDTFEQGPGGDQYFEIESESDADLFEGSGMGSGYHSYAEELKDNSFTPDTVYFSFDSYTLNWEAKEALLRYSKELLEGTDNAQIGGHCDSRGTSEYNFALGLKRAKSVQAEMISQGNVPSSRLTAKSYGKEKPAVKDYDQKTYALNRRAELSRV